jgi:hypothetical protein
MDHGTYPPVCAKLTQSFKIAFFGSASKIQVLFAITDNDFTLG